MGALRFIIAISDSLAFRYDKLSRETGATISKKSAGILLFREKGAGVEVLLAHPGGPFWAKKDDGAWSIPKGEFTDDEEPLPAARREFAEEMGIEPVGELLPLSSVRQAGGKQVFAWAIRGEFDVAALKSNTFSMEWPPKSGKEREFPEVDKAAWFSIDAARVKILQGQAAFLDRLLQLLSKSD